MTTEKENFGVIIVADDLALLQAALELLSVDFACARLNASPHMRVKEIIQITKPAPISGPGLKKNIPGLGFDPK